MTSLQTQKFFLFLCTALQNEALIAGAKDLLDQVGNGNPHLQCLALTSSKELILGCAQAWSQGELIERSEGDAVGQPPDVGCRAAGDPAGGNATVSPAPGPHTPPPVT